eukprot:gb/GFBE01013666.1/.p1 GENE.gb/GFBE01013666.1/~~gb/GFBE01013666.1/.p1  ORF type:complete len:387 (+),score=71.87 gb/GFBE01013666.1/:1-1161(+)
MPSLLEHLQTERLQGCSSPSLAPRKNPFEFSTPKRPGKCGAMSSCNSFASPKMRPCRNFYDDDQCSTAAPSPALTAGFGSPAPWDSPVSAKMPRSRKGSLSQSGLPTIHSCSDFLRDLDATMSEMPPPLFDFEMMAGMGRPLTPMVESELPGCFASPPKTPQTPGGVLEGMESPLSAMTAFSKNLTTCDSPVLTPRKEKETAPTPTTPPPAARSLVPPGAPARKRDMPPLMRALYTTGPGSITAVQAALNDDPQAALLPFWEHDLEPPLCLAVRVGCDAEVITMLIQAGADVTAQDRKGRSPMNILGSRMQRFDFAMPDMAVFGGMDLEAEKTRDRSIEQALLEAGAAPLPPRSFGHPMPVGGDLFDQLFSQTLPLWPSLPPPVLA